MKRSQFVEQVLHARISLDAKLPKMRSAATVFTKPRGGWIHTVRLALGMSISDLAVRLGVKPSTIHRLEASEAAGAIRMESLNRIAEELGCDVVYALIPRKDVAETVMERAREIAKRELAGTHTTMALEDQAIREEIWEKLVAQRATELSESAGLWRTTNRDVTPRLGP